MGSKGAPDPEQVEVCQPARLEECGYCSCLDLGRLCLVLYVQWSIPAQAQEGSNGKRLGSSVPPAHGGACVGSETTVQSTSLIAMYGTKLPLNV